MGKKNDRDYTIDSRFGNKIRTARKKMGLTIEEVAEETGYSTTHITRLELSQRRATDIILLYKFSKLLNLPFDELIYSVLPEELSTNIGLKKIYPSLDCDKEIAISSMLQLITTSEFTYTEVLFITDMINAYIKVKEEKK